MNGQTHLGSFRYVSKFSNNITYSKNNELRFSKYVFLNYDKTPFYQEYVTMEVFCLDVRTAIFF